jgi:hypothetical protein
MRHSLEARLDEEDLHRAAACPEMRTARMAPIPSG